MNKIALALFAVVMSFSVGHTFYIYKQEMSKMSDEMIEMALERSERNKMITSIMDKMETNTQELVSLTNEIKSINL